MADTLSDFFEKFPTRMTPERLGAWQASMLLDITGDGGGQWVVAVSEGKMNVSRDVPALTDTTITVGAPDFHQIIEGKMNPNMAFMTGKLKVKGAMGNAMKLSGLLIIK